MLRVRFLRIMSKNVFWLLCSVELLRFLAVKSLNMTILAKQ